MTSDETSAPTPPAPDAPSGGGRPGALTAEIFAELGKTLLETTKFNPAFVDGFLALASAEAKPRSRDIEALLQEEELLE